MHTTATAVELICSSDLEPSARYADPERGDGTAMSARHAQGWSISLQGVFASIFRPVYGVLRSVGASVLQLVHRAVDAVDRRTASATRENALHATHHNALG